MIPVIKLGTTKYVKRNEELIHLETKTTVNTALKNKTRGQHWWWRSGFLDGPQKNLAWECEVVKHGITSVWGSTADPGPRQSKR